MSEDFAMKNSTMGSNFEASENEFLTSRVRTVVAGWRKDTNGMENWCGGLYSPLRTMDLDLLAMLQR